MASCSKVSQQDSGGRLYAYIQSVSTCAQKLFLVKFLCKARLAMTSSTSHCHRPQTSCDEQCHHLLKLTWWNPCLLLLRGGSSTIAARSSTTTAAAAATAATTATSTATQLDESLHTHLIHVIPVKYGYADWQRRMWVQVKSLMMS